MTLDANTVHLIDQAAAEFFARVATAGVALDPATVEFVLRDSIALAVAVRPTVPDAVPFTIWHAIYNAEAVGLDDFKATLARLPWGTRP